jgi:hypothetical protein
MKQSVVDIGSDLTISKDGKAQIVTAEDVECIEDMSLVIC